MVKIRIHHHSFLDRAGHIYLFLCFYIILFFITGKLSFIAIKPLAFLGTYFQPLPDPCKYKWPRYGIFICPARQHIFSVYNTLFCSLLVATVITFGIEKPAMNYMRSAYKKWRLVMDNKNAEK